MIIFTLLVRGYSNNKIMGSKDLPVANLEIVFATYQCIIKNTILMHAFVLTQEQLFAFYLALLIQYTCH